jgi:putative hemolysin
VELYAFAALLLFSAFFSGAESAFVNAQNAKAFVWHRQKRRFSKLYIRYIHNADKYLVTVLVGNNFVNIALSTIGAILFIPLYGEGTSVLIVTAFVLIFSEITPKVLFTVFADKAILPLIPLIRLFEFILKPISFIAEWLSAKLIQLEKSEMSDIFSHHELDHIFAESKQSGVVEIDEHKYIKNIFLLSSTRVKEIMIPRADIVALDKSVSIDELYKKFEETGFSRIPVYTETIDHIVGIIFAHDLLTKPESIEDVIQPTLFVPETKSCKELLLEMQEQNRSLAITIDEFGGVAGMVRIEQLVGVIVGHIDEHAQHKHERRIIKISNGKYKVSGRVEKEILAEELMLELPDGDYETVAGLVLAHLERFPELDETIAFDGFTFRIIGLDQKQIEWILVQVTDD